MAAKVHLSVAAETTLGNEVRVTGSVDALGAWHPAAGVPLRTGPGAYPIWSGAVLMPSGVRKLEAVEYKFVVVGPGGKVMWEEGPNRSLPTALLPKDMGLAVELDLAHFGQAMVAAASAVPRLLMSPGGRQILLMSPRRSATAALPPIMDIAWRATCSGTFPGDTIVVVGGGDALGNWDPQRGLRLSTSPTAFPLWSGSARLPVPHAGLVAWKLVCVSADGHTTWEPGENRQTELWKDHKVDSWLIQVTFGGNGRAEPAPRRSSPLGLRPPRSPALPSPPSPSVSDEDGSDDDPRWPSKPREHGLKERPNNASSASVASTTASGAWTDGASTDTEESPSKGSIGDGCYSSMDEQRPDAHEAPPTSPSGCPASSRLRLWAGAHQVRKPGGRCEDSHFLGTCALGVADGVGSMAEFARFGVNAAAYAAELMACAAAAAASQQGEGLGPAERARAALATAEAEVKAYGASTVLVLTLEEDGALGAANLGDSGFALLRREEPCQDWAVVARSKEQQHFWNCPYQLLRLPKNLISRMRSGVKFDTAANCDVYELAAQAGDLVLLFTDGLSDNLHEAEVLEIVGRMTKRSQPVKEEEERPSSLATGSAASDLPTPEALAQELALAAQVRSLDPLASVPFAEACVQQGLSYRGGKPDDITVVAAWVRAQ